MVDFLLDDVKELLSQEKGDSKILQRIKRAAERGEVISIYERQYVKDLAEKHLRQKHSSFSTASPNSTDNNASPSKHEISESIKKPIFVSKSDSKTTKIAFGVGSIALAIILITGISMSEINSIDLSTEKKELVNTMPSFQLETDSTSYKLGDIISISGVADPKLNNITLEIKNPDNIVIWKETIKIKNNGHFSTLVIAGGQGWEKNGQYELTSSNELEEQKITFTFSN